MNDDVGKRPPFCIEQNCRCLASGGTDTLDKGASVMCFGKIRDPNIVHFTFKATVHPNTHHHCFYTPMKGWIKSMVTWDDLWNEMQLIQRMANIEGWRKCTECGKSAIVASLWAEDEKRICEKCKVEQVQKGSGGRQL